MSQDIFYRPRPDWVGDVIPFVDGDEFKLYYLYEGRRSPKPGTPWHLVTTTDLVHYEECGEVVPSGGAGAEDFNAYTGSVVRDDEGVHHLFYTANNPDRLAPDGRSLQLVAHATGTDLLTWTKHPEDTFGAPQGYDPADWRDPFVYRDPQGEGWSMILAARHRRGEERRRGVVARLVSDDLRTWKPVEPLWDPHRYLTQECPELFRMGQWWYLVYSEFTDRFVTRYRMSRSPEGPWTAPERDTVDGRGFYAAKSAERDGRRIFFGWIASRQGERDDGRWLWAGTLAALEAVQEADGTLSFRPPREVLQTYSRQAFAVSEPVRMGHPDVYASTVLTEVLPDDVRLAVDLDWKPGTREIGLLVRTDGSGENGYVLRLEPDRRRLVLDRWPRPVHGTEQWHISGDVPHVVELERPVDLSAGHAHLDVLLRDELLQCCVDGAVCLSTPVYDHPRGRVGLSALDGEVACTRLDVLLKS